MAFISPSSFYFKIEVYIKANDQYFFFWPFFKTMKRWNRLTACRKSIKIINFLICLTANPPGAIICLKRTCTDDSFPYFLRKKKSKARQINCLRVCIDEHFLFFLSSCRTTIIFYNNTALSQTDWLMTGIPHPLLIRELTMSPCSYRYVSFLNNKNCTRIIQVELKTTLR